VCVVETEAEIGVKPRRVSIDVMMDGSCAHCAWMGNPGQAATTPAVLTVPAPATCACGNCVCSAAPRRTAAPSPVRTFVSNGRLIQRCARGKAASKFQEPPLQDDCAVGALACGWLGSE
jgi:hypothetical protein